MSKRRCPECGALFDKTQHKDCPKCQERRLAELITLRKNEGGGGSDSTYVPSKYRDKKEAKKPPEPEGTILVGAGPAVGGEAVDIEPLPEPHANADPVAGWLVCVGGPSVGLDFRIGLQRNSIGRDEGNRVRIGGDHGISGKNQAVISYDPRKNNYHLAPGDSKNITYVNGDQLLMPVELKPYDLIEVGQATELLFVPFCGEQFQWPKK